MFHSLFLSHPFSKVHTYILFDLALLRLIFSMVFFDLNDFCLDFFSIGGLNFLSIISAHSPSLIDSVMISLL